MPRRESLDLDLQHLHDLAVNKEKLTKQASSNRLKFAENQERFERVGFDLFRDAESEFIWKLEKDSETGEEYIIRTASVDPQYKTSSNWRAELDSNKTAVTLIYKGHAIKAFKKADLNLNEENAEQWRRYLVDKVTTDPTFLNKVLTQVGNSRKKFILGKFPELTK